MEPTGRGILDLASQSEYDFRDTACAEDPSSERFAEWVPYFRTKWAIARLLQPTSILEIGVGYGYSAAALLNSCASATYLGIIDQHEETRCRENVDWANQITSSYSAKFVRVEFDSALRFPGEVYDLIHIELQQDADESVRNLKLAIKRGRYVLVGGRSLTLRNFLAFSTLLYGLGDQIEYCLSIPNGGSHWLIKPHTLDSDTPTTTEITASEDLRQTYTAEYYLTDCGGFSQYQNTGGKKLDDDRLATVAAVASLSSGERVLDLGCGRGELAYFFAQQGSRVTAIDYSDDAIKLTERTFAGEPDLRSRVELRHANICEVELSGHYDLAVASDAVEHLTARELDGLYEKVSQHLEPRGIFVIHTYPNLWYFKYDYARKRRLAEALGSYLPKEPRTEFELLMHINEQNPRMLRRQLGKYFSNVLLWFGEPGNMGGSLLRTYSHRELAAARDLWAIVSNRPVEPETVRDRLQSWPLTIDQMRDVRLSALNPPTAVQAGHEFIVTLEVCNRSDAALKSMQPHPVHISYHWIGRDGLPAIFDGVRTRIQPFLPPGRTRQFDVSIVPPAKPDTYKLRLTLVQEGIRWFDLPPVEVMADSWLEVVA